MSGDTELEKRVEQLETRLAFMDDAQATLSDALARQQQDILDLRRRCEHLAQRLQQLEASSPGAAGEMPEGPPPHY